MSSHNSFRSASPPPIYDAHPPNGLRPYLQLPHLLSLTWLAYPILSLVFVAFRIQLSLDSSQDAVANAKQNLIASCKAAETAATSAASMPRFMALATNQQYADAVNASMEAARGSLIFTLTVMEAIINFIIDLYRSTFLCFVELIIRGGLSILISAVQEISDFITSALNGIRTSIQNDVSTANSAIQSAVSALNKVNPFGDISVPQFSIPSLSGLENVKIPTDFEDSLVKLNSSLPTFTDIKQALESVLDTPFELVKKDINETFSNFTFTADGLPVPQQNSVSFCADLDTSIVDDLGKDLIKAAKIGICVIIAIIIILILLNCALEWYKWRCQQQHLEYTRQAWLTDPTINHPVSTKNLSAPTLTLTDHNLLMLQANGAHPLLTRIANTTSAKLRLSPSKHINLQWFLHYVFHAPALACFLIGFFGLLSVQLQLFALGPLEATYSAKTAASVSDFSNTIATSLNSSMFNQSSAYANDVNGRVDAMQSSINDGLFGWVNQTTTTLNATLNEFYDTVQGAVETIFGGTILDQPAQEFVKCLIGSKVDALESAITFLHDNLKVNIPRVNQSVLVLSPSSVNDVTKPIAAAAVGGDSADDSGGLVGKIIRAYEASLRKERIMFAIFMALWGVVVIMALCIIAWHSYGVPLMEARRKRRWEREQRSGIDGLVVPYRLGQPPLNRDLESSRETTRSFTPLPQPVISQPWEGSTSQSPSVNGSEISKPKKLMAIGRKAMGKEQLVSDSREGSFRDIESQSSSHPGLWSRAVGLFSKKRNDEPESPMAESLRRPKLTINVDRASGSTNRQPSDLRSTWSISPTPEQSRSSLLPWTKPILKSRDSAGSNAGIAGVGSMATNRAPAPTPLALPLHHQATSSSTAPRSRQLSSTPPPLMSPPLRPTYSLAPPPEHHKRMSNSSSVTAGGIGTLFVVNDAGSIVDSDESHGPSVTPVTRMLTTTSARRSSNVDPFATPFDDEHAVRPGPAATVQGHLHPGPTGAGLRKSIQTNPFNAIAF